MTSMRTRRRLIDRLRSHGIDSERILGIMEATPRHLFIGEALAHKAYEDTALPIGYNQTISQPWVVARMTELLLEHDESPKKVLEVGTGCGYQTAVLCALDATVHSVEVVEPLATAAAARLAALGYAQATVRAGDGRAGWPEHAPYDGIVVTAAAPSVPPALVAQLKPGACLLIPVGRAAATQSLERIRKRDDGSCETATVLPVAFVPLTGGVKT